MDEALQGIEKTGDSQKNRIQDLLDENASLRADIKLLTQQKQKLQIELEKTTDYIITIEEKVYKANKISVELLKQLKDAEADNT